MHSYIYFMNYMHHVTVKYLIARKSDDREELTEKIRK